MTEARAMWTTAATAMLAALGLATGAAAQPVAELVVTGVGGRVSHVGAAQLAALPQVSVHVVQHGQAHDFIGPLALDVLAAIGAPRGEALRGRAVGYAVAAMGRDGYVAALSLAECDRALRPVGRVIVATREDGRALPAGEGPLRLVVEGDARPARAVRDLTALRLVDLHAPAAPRLTQP